jgi:hypothetical protein
MLETTAEEYELDYAYGIIGEDMNDVETSDSCGDIHVYIERGLEKPFKVKAQKLDRNTKARMITGSYDLLLEHTGHKIACVFYGPNKAGAQNENVAIECEDCSQVLVDFDKED